MILESNGEFKVSAQYIESENLDGFIDLSLEIPGKNYSAKIRAGEPVIYVNGQHIEEEFFEDYNVRKFGGKLKFIFPDIFGILFLSHMDILIRAKSIVVQDCDGLCVKGGTENGGTI
uniref:Uncharacterized protein n=1 Tax=Panagrolaimus superbus TaxID=310955 RepID=A0A914YXU0_9BILA